MNSDQQLIRTLLDAPEFRQALTAALDGRRRHLEGKLRSHSRSGESIQAAHVAGLLDAYDGLPQLLESFATPGKTGV